MRRPGTEDRAPSGGGEVTYIIECEDCNGTLFELHRRNGEITFVCKGCGSCYIDDEGFGRP